MRIAVISKADASGGGASRVAGDVVNEMERLGHDVVHFVAREQSKNDQEISFVFGGKLSRKILDLGGRILRRIGFGELIPIELFHVLLKTMKFDIIHVHDTSSAFSPLTLAAISKFAPVIWTIHDCSPFTGGCLYPQLANCERYMSGCGSCPQKGVWPIDGYLDTTSYARGARSWAFKNGNITPVTPSAWMSDVAYSSNMFEKAPQVISNTIDLEVFSPAKKRLDLRKRLGVSAERRVITLSSANIADQRKGLSSSLEIVRNIKEKDFDVEVVLIGAPSSEISGHLEGVDFTATGYVSNRRHLAEWLGISDVFLTTASVDNQPLAVMEALSCGVPVYGWKSGGIVEMVSDGNSGRLFERGVISEVSDQFISDSDNDKFGTMGQLARDFALENFNSDLFGKQYEELFRSKCNPLGGLE